MLKRLLLREKESDKGCFLFQGSLPQMRYRTRCWTHRLQMILNMISDALNFEYG